MSRLAAVALFAVVSLAACNQAPPAPPAAPAPPAVSEAPVAPPPAAPAEAKPGSTLAVTAADLGTELGDDGRIMNAKENFAPSDTIIVAITTDNVGAPPATAQVTARWIGPDGAVFNEETREQEFAGTQYVSFRVAEPKGFARGRYKLEVALNGSTVQMREFTIN